MQKQRSLCSRWLRLSLAVALATLATLWIGTPAHAGAGVGVSTDASGAPVSVPTYYANSPAGTWVDWAGNEHDSGAPLRKFIDPLPGLCPAGAIPQVSGGGGTPIAGKCIPVATPDQVSFPGSDYYEIGIVEYAEQMHGDLPKPTTLRGYVQLNDPANPVTPASAAANARYLGPIIVAKRGVPVRIKYSNLLPTGHFNGSQRNGDLFIPVDRTLMGAGTGPLGGTELYTENRAEIHLHGGDNPWISDGTPHQWITPAGEATSYPVGVSFMNVPDMPVPGQGSGTLYYPNGDGARLMFYHDHAAGITRLNVYAGEAAGYLLTEPAVENALPLPATGQVPLVIQERTFVPKDINTPSGTSPGQDAKWNTAAWGGYGDFWFPHVYETNQDPASFDGTNPVGRWDYGPWFWPVFPVSLPLPSGDYGDVSTTPEAFGDTPLVNGTAYPSVALDPTAYRFRILNACNDRSLNLGFYTADPTVLTSDGRRDTEVRMIPFIGPNGPMGSYQCPASGWTETSASYPVPFPCAGGLNGTGWGQQDSRTGGIPDPGTIGPDIYQIGTEGGLLPKVAVIPSTPTNFDYNKKSITVLNVQEHGLFLMAAERADAVVDFSRYAGQTLLLYNDAPAALPAGDLRNDYYTGDQDQTAVGGAPATQAGFGPNTRTVMQFKIGIGSHPNAGKIASIKLLSGGIGYSAESSIQITDGDVTDYGVAMLGPGGVITAITPQNPDTVYGSAPRIELSGPGSGAAALSYLTPAPAYDLAALNAALPAAFAASQPRPIVAQTAYNAAYPPGFSGDQYARIFTGASSQPQVTWIDGYGAPRCYSVSGTCLNGTTSVPADGLIFNKAIQELFDSRGRMNATLGVELPYTSSVNQTTIPLAYIDPVTEEIKDGETQIWKITHNGVDSHPVHFHLVNVQVLNRIGWDGTVKPPFDNELGWKETVRMNPLEDIVVALRAKQPQVPFGLPDSIRYLDPTQAPNRTMGFTQIDPLTGNPAQVSNVVANFGWEYVWHCHILGHEENDFMRPFVLRVAATLPSAPTLTGAVLASSVAPFGVQLAWQDNSSNEIGFQIQRALVTNNVVGAFATVGSALANATGYLDTPLLQGRSYAYRVAAYNSAGTLVSNVLQVTTPVGIPSAPSALSASASAAGAPSAVTLTWTNNDPNLVGATIQRAGNIGFTSGLASFTVNAANPTSYLDTAVQPTTTYYYRVSVATGAGSSPNSATAVVTTNGPMAAPTGLRALSVINTTGGLNNGQAILTWNVSTGAQGYYIQRSPATGPQVWTQVGTSTTTNFRNTGLARGGYLYRVQSYIGTSVSAFSAPLTVTIN